MILVVLEVSFLLWELEGGEVVLAVNFLHWLQNLKFLLWLSLEWWKPANSVVPVVVVV